jgi:hypothetical protein
MEAARVASMEAPMEAGAEALVVAAVVAADMKEVLPSKERLAAAAQPLLHQRTASLRAR